MPTLTDFCGLNVNLDAVISLFRSKRAPQATILYGAAGLGKRTLARLLCMSALCRQEDAPCGHCRQCMRIEKQSHPNVHFLRAENGTASIKIEQVRTMIDAISGYAIEEGDSVVVIENIDLMTEHAQNALLKSLEEPHDAVRFILTVHSLRSVLPTVLSRCTRTYVPPMPKESVKNILMRDHRLAPAQAQALAEKADGNLQKALDLMHNKQSDELSALVQTAFFERHSIKTMLQKANELKNSKDQADAVLKCYEMLLETAPLPPKRKIARYNALMRARMLKNANVSWQAILDTLFNDTLEETP